jgi:hypothetical protein
MKNMAHIAPVTKLEADITLNAGTPRRGVLASHVTGLTKAEGANSGVVEVIDLVLIAIPLEEARAQGSSKALLRQ